MFEMFDRDGWPPEERRACIARKFKGRRRIAAAERATGTIAYPPDFRVLRNRVDISDSRTLEAAGGSRRPAAY